VTHHGSYYDVEGVSLAPVPVQRPRVPIWIGGDSPAAHRRAARWDGWLAGGDNEQGEMVLSPKVIGELCPRHPIAMTGVSAGPHDPVLAEYERAGLTWWLEHLHERRAPFEELMARVQAGPPAS
jgi:hypothetical protein